MSEQPTLADLTEQLKNHLLENDGEVVYWGEPVILSEAKDLGLRSKRGDSSAAPQNDNGTKAALLESLRAETIGDCQRCPLGKTRIKLVFGVGNPEADVMFVGEGPGFDEDRQGEPFVGKAGQLLDKIIGAIGLDRTNVYIANVVKCHPMVDPTDPTRRGNDRPPSPEEMEECLPFLKEQIRIIAPKFIVTLGATATKALLGRREGITALRGKFFDFSVDESTPPIQLLPTFHPAALLRDELLKRPVWEDMKLLREHMTVIARRP